MPNLRWHLRSVQVSTKGKMRIEQPVFAGGSIVDLRTVLLVITLDHSLATAGTLTVNSLSVRMRLS